MSTKKVVRKKPEEREADAKSLAESLSSRLLETLRKRGHKVDADKNWEGFVVPSHVDKLPLFLRLETSRSRGWAYCSYNGKVKLSFGNGERRYSAVFSKLPNVGPIVDRIEHFLAGELAQREQYRKDECEGKRLLAERQAIARQLGLQGDEVVRAGDVRATFGSRAWCGHEVEIAGLSREQTVQVLKLVQSFG